MATQPIPTPSGVKTFTVKKRVFNLDKFEKESLEAQGTFTPLTAVENLAEIEPAKLLSLVNAGLEKEAKKTAKASIAGASPKVVNTFVNAFRLIAPYSKMFVMDGENIKKDAEGNSEVDRKAQTQAIYAMIKSNPAMLEGLKEAAAADSGDDDDESDNEE